MRSRSAWPLWRDLIRAAIGLGSIGLLAIGVSGLVAAALGAAFGQPFVAGDRAGVAYTSDRCADLFEYAPHAGTCADAATTHHFGELVTYRLAAGVLGLIGLAAWWLLRRRARPPAVLPEAFEATVATVAFGVGAAALLLQSAGRAVVGGESTGVGELLSGGLVAAVAAAIYGAVAYRALLRRAASLPGT